MITLVVLYDAFMALSAASTILTIIGWTFYILIVSFLVKVFYPPHKPSAQIPCWISAVIGSFVGGVFNYLLGTHDRIFAASGVVMGLVGTFAFLLFYDYKNSTKDTTNINTSNKET